MIRKVFGSRGGMIVLQKYAVLVAVTLFAVAIGCTPPKEQTNTTASTTSDRNRPPLRIGLISQPDGLEEIIKTRWASVSEQKLEFVSLREADAGGPDSSQLDVIVSPAFLLGTMVEEKWVSELPKELVEKELTGQQSSESTVNQFPQHWLSLAQYGRAYYGVPFGASLMLAGTPVDQTLNQTQLVSQDRTKNSLLPSFVLDWSKDRLTVPKELNPLSADLVEHYLVVASSRRPDLYEASLLFKLLDCSSRLSEPWAIESAEILRDLYHATPENRVPIVLGWEPSQSDKGLSWQVPTFKRAVNTTSDSKNATDEQSQQQSDWNILTDSTRSPLFLLASSSRQSSKSIFFLKWLCEPSQRSALAKMWPCSFPVSDGSSQPNGYRDVAYKASNADDIPTFFKLRHGLKYREAIHRALKRIVDDPALNVATVMQECSIECDQITTSLGRDFQQDSLERSLNLK